MAGDAAQFRAFTHFFRHSKDESKWVAIFDIDEFVLPHRRDSLRAFLLNYRHSDEVGINRVMFGDGHHKMKPDGGVIENCL